MNNGSGALLQNTEIAPVAFTKAVRNQSMIPLLAKVHHAVEHRMRNVTYINRFTNKRNVSYPVWTCREPKNFNSKDPNRALKHLP